MRLTLLGESNVPSVQFESLTIGKCRAGRVRTVDHHDVPLLVISDGFEDLLSISSKLIRFDFALNRDLSNSLRAASFSRGSTGAASEIGLV
jgi:hypothetical protein